MVSIVLWPQRADDDDTCSNVNIGLWPLDVLTSLAQERPGAPRGAQETGHNSVICAVVWMPCSTVRMAIATVK